MNAPAVTVLLAVWNPNHRFLQDAVRSILEQTFTDFELVIVEDPSPASIEDLVAGFDDPRIRLVRREVRGTLGSALNLGLELARGELVARIDADDIALPQRLERQVAFMRSHPEIAVYGSRIRVIDESERVVGRRMLPLRHDEIAATLRRYNCISHPSVMFRKAIVLARGGYDKTIGTEDYDLWCRMLLAGDRFENSAEDLICYRFHEEAAKFRGVHDSIRTTIAIKRRYFTGRFDLIDYMRLIAEFALLALPSWLIVRLFRKTEYRARP